MKRLIGMTLITSLFFTTAAYALPAGVTEVKDEKTGEVRYRLSGEQESDPRTYTYEQMMQEEEGYEIVGRDTYDEDDTYHDPVTVNNINALAEYHDDGYDVANFKVYLANYLNYFTEDDTTFYTATIDGDSFKNSTRYGGIICFTAEVEEYPGMKISCEYHKKFKLFGFNSELGDMSLEAQFYISDLGYSISRKTLLEYGEGKLISKLPRSGNEKRSSEKKVFISSTQYKGKQILVNKWFYIDDGADESLLGYNNYSKSQVLQMLNYLTLKSGGEIDFTECLPEVWDFYESTHIDVAAMLSIVMTEGNYKTSSNAAYWNFFNYKTPPGGSSISGKNLWNAKADCKTIGQAMVAGFRWIYKNYWLRGQDTYYLMAFNDYGYPQSSDEANVKYHHCYRPWFDDTGYISSGYDDYYAWCNKCARRREELINEAK